MVFQEETLPQRSYDAVVHQDITETSQCIGHEMHTHTDLLITKLAQTDRKGQHPFVCPQAQVPCLKVLLAFSSSQM